MLMETIEEPKQADHAVTAVIFAHTAMVLVLDVLTHVGIAIGALHVFPLGFTRWSMRAVAAFSNHLKPFPKTLANFYRLLNCQGYHGPLCAVRLREESAAL